MTGTLHFPGDVGGDLDRLLTLIETAHEHGDEAAIVAQAAKLRAALTPSALSDRVKCPDCDGHGFIAPLENMPETAEDCDTCEGVGSIPSALSGDAGEGK